LGEESTGGGGAIRYEGVRGGSLGIRGQERDCLKKRSVGDLQGSANYDSRRFKEALKKKKRDLQALGEGNETKRGGGRVEERGGEPEMGKELH